jgi:hypothetical protein
VKDTDAKLMDQIQQIKNENAMEAMDNQRMKAHARQGSHVSIG